ncbi:uncharacterized protein [Typha angustifolia]|uniref:uncharacterized protein n=1 Tax=Typha angustifolia TaxID=59011 RepID=UPI003C2F7672
MASRKKEDEKNEKVIRGLQKLPANRRCINCNSLGPQYVCTNFSTFICINCSGIHREFTHRVKSISMAKFTSLEVSALEDGGNEKAKQIYLKEWDSQRHSAPDSSDVDRLREFIKHVYVDRRYAGERSIDRPPRVKGDREDSYESNRTDSHMGGSRSPPYDDTYEHSYGERPGSRDPGYGQADNRRSPGRFEVAVERGRDDSISNGNHSGVMKLGIRSPNNQKDLGASSAPMVQPVRDILRGVPPIRVGETAKSNGNSTINFSTQAQTAPSSSNKDSSQVNSVDAKMVNSKSLIDFDSDPEPFHAGVAKSVSQQINPQPVVDGGWASFDTSGPQKVPEVTSSTNTLASAFGQWAAPGASTPGTSFPTQPVTEATFFPKVTDGGQWSNTQQHQLSMFPVASSQANNPQSSNMPVVAALNNQSWVAPTVPNIQGNITAPSGQVSQVVTKGPHEAVLGVTSHPPFEAKPSGRKALPEDLFAMIYPPVTSPVTVWQTSPYPAIMGYGMQYPNANSVAAFAHSTKSANPFDVANETKLMHASTFPSLSSLQGALPNVNNAVTLSHAASVGSLAPQWVPSQQPSYAPFVNPSPYMFQQNGSNLSHQVHTNSFPLGQQAIGGVGNEGNAYGLSSLDQHLSARNARPSTPNSFTHVGGNPFA